MNTNFKSESGIDLLQRLAVRPKLLGLQVEIFGLDGPRPGDVIELNERGFSGKTLMLTQWVIKCILPSKWKNVTLDGLGVGVVLLSTDHHFSLLHLVSLLERRVKRILREFGGLEHGTGSLTIEEIRQDSLKRLCIFECFSENQLMFNFCSIKTYILSHPQFSVIAIDSLTAYYWEHRIVSTTMQSLESYCHSLLNNLIDKLRQTNMTIIYCVQQFTRETVEKEACEGTTTPFIYSVTMENCDKLTVSVDDRRNQCNFVKDLSTVKGELCFQ